MSVRNLKKLIKLICEEILGEPDESRECERNKDKDKEENPKDEQNLAAAVPGVMTPLGTGPTYPASIPKKKRKKKKKAAARDWYKN